MVQVNLRAVRVDVQSNTPVLLLQETTGLNRTLPIYVGPAEASSIAMAMNGIEVPRPLTHDLFKELFDALDISLERVVITELKDKVFYAELHVISNTKKYNISARPSDAIAIAIRMGVPIFVADDLMQEEGLEIPSELLEDDVEQNPEAVVGEFREFLKNIKPEDFQQ
jgi:bifunctional DNase/RNase